MPPPFGEGCFGDGRKRQRPGKNFFFQNHLFLISFVRKGPYGPFSPKNPCPIFEEIGLKNGGKLLKTLKLTLKSTLKLPPFQKTNEHGWLSDPGMVTFENYHKMAINRVFTL